ncbi:DUF3703 domain-containing protein [Parvularcula sp. ZS-1/3]|uniref:DUF3703 domain-containing protein n=1 Tax=Parvularcula mediterranea TaxID=2732508 RepID=A0A7Y3W5X4_9PROT|nr:DUF3703 domain-containing protein [Parvularcula mediterranea]NNU17064.1 DUF3703 domain-containing protein [Parvularcula mediterranea]
MRKFKKDAFRREMAAGRAAFGSGDLDRSFHHFERAHILGQRWLLTHLSSHWWMLRVALKRRDGREIRGQLSRMMAVFPGYAFGWVPKGNTGGANVHPLKPMAIPDDLKSDLGRYSVTLDVLGRLPFLALVALVAFATYTEWNHRQQSEVIENDWQNRSLESVRDFGSVESLEILPLVGWLTDDDELMTEAGVSLLIKADDTTILYDFGLNAEGGSPSPLEANMRSLGVEPSEIDAIFISHRHRDHVGGKRWADAGSFSFGKVQQDLTGVTAWVPTELSHPTASVDLVSGPRKLAPGIASTGPIARQLFIGPVEEQALVINVEGRGLVTIVGCGHQTVPKLLTLIDEVFDEPLYGVVGDLHFPVPEGRLRMMGIDVQRRLASGRGSLAPIDRQDFLQQADRLSARLKMAALGGHDTSDEALGTFEALMGARFERLQVGRPVILTAPDQGAAASPPPQE